ETPGASSVDSYYYRKVDTNYYEYAPIDKYTKAVKFDPEVYDEINFLKENLKTGDYWYSKQFIGTATFGQQILLQYHFRCINANATIVYNGQAFTNVYEIVMNPEIAAVGYNPGPTQETYTYYYARGIGLIYTDFNNSYYIQPVLQIRNWTVN
ncbi:MAG: hypothetical protein JST96_18410, partial [Bacteroidetes bacterium]|nr:hypothetical protein [Bacteroidota bacterium]